MKTPPLLFLITPRTFHLLRRVSTRDKRQAQTPIYKRIVPKAEASGTTRFAQQVSISACVSGRESDRGRVNDRGRARACARACGQSSSHPRTSSQPQP